MLSTTVNSSSHPFGTDPSSNAFPGTQQLASWALIHLSRFEVLSFAFSERKPGGFRAEGGRALAGLFGNVDVFFSSVFIFCFC